MMNVPYHEPAEWIKISPRESRIRFCLRMPGARICMSMRGRYPSIRDEECDAARCTQDRMNLPSPEEYYVEDRLISDYEGPMVLRLSVLRIPVNDDEFNLRWNGILRYVCVLADSSQSSHDTSDRHDEESSDENSSNGSANAARVNGDSEEAESDVSVLSPSSGSDSNNSDPSPQAPGAPRQRRLLGIPMALSTEVTICPLLPGSLTAGQLSIPQSTWPGKLNSGLLKACNYHQRYAQGFAAAKASDDSLISSGEENREKAIKSHKWDKLPSSKEIRKPAIWHGWIFRYMKYAFRDRTTHGVW